MKPKVACRKCGSSNEINRVFCKKCGTKLDLSNLVMAGPRRSPGQVVLGFIRFVVLVVVMVCQEYGSRYWASEKRLQYQICLD